MLRKLKERGSSAASFSGSKENDADKRPGPSLLLEPTDIREGLTKLVPSGEFDIRGIGMGDEARECRADTEGGEFEGVANMGDGRGGIGSEASKSM